MLIGRRPAFSLLEVLITVAILAALLGLAAPYYQDYLGTGRHTAMLHNLKTVKKALMDYKADLGTYPRYLSYLAAPESDPNFVGREPVRYLLEIPTDPEANAVASWGYTPTTDASGRPTYSLATKYTGL